MENLDEVNKLEGGLRHLRFYNSDEIAKYSVPVKPVARPGFNQSGKEIDLLVNAFPIVKFPNRTIYQYDVSSLPISPLQAASFFVKGVGSARPEKQR